jgi:hypothetical protein
VGLSLPRAIKEFCERISAVAHDLSEIDPDSYSYRYPIDRDGNPSTKPHQTLNLEALSNVMGDLLYGMKSIDFGLEVETSRAQEVYELLQTLE